MKNEQMHEAQRLYFQSEMSNTKIAETVGVSRRTLLYWIAENNWERLRDSAAAMPALITEKVYHIMDMMTDQLLLPDRCGAPFTRGEVDNLYKLSMTISKLKARNSLNENMEMFANFTDDLQRVDPALAEQLAPHIDRYIAARSSVSSNRLTENRVAAIERKADANWENARDDRQEAEAMHTWAAQSTNQPAANANAVPAAPPAPKEKFDIRKQLRGTSTKGPGKSFHQQKQTSTAA
jgi:hypothetical protein